MRRSFPKITVAFLIITISGISLLWIIRSGSPTERDIKSSHTSAQRSASIDEKLDTQRKSSLKSSEIVTWRVVTPEGAPIPEACATLRFFRNLEREPVTVFETKTDESGRFSVVLVSFDLPSGTSQPSFYHCRFAVCLHAQGFVDSLFWLPPHSRFTTENLDKSIPEQILLRHGETFHGTVLDPGGKPLVGAQLVVEAVGERFVRPDIEPELPTNLVTDSEGIFSLAYFKRVIPLSMLPSSSGMFLSVRIMSYSFC